MVFNVILFFSKSTFSKKSLGLPSECQTVSIQDRHLVGSDLGPKCLQRLSADDTRRQFYKKILGSMNHLKYSLQYWKQKYTEGL